jgi:uncharacterized protein YijF (DUF1287 family)
MPNILEGQYIVSKDRNRVLAKFCKSVDIRAGNQYRWATPALTQSVYQAQPDDRVVEPINHTVEVDYHAGDIVVWRYVGDAPHTAFDDPSWFQKL